MWSRILLPFQRYYWICLGFKRLFDYIRVPTTSFRGTIQSLVVLDFKLRLLNLGCRTDLHRVQGAILHAYHSLLLHWSESCARYSHLYVGKKDRSEYETYARRRNATVRQHAKTRPAETRWLHPRSQVSRKGYLAEQ